MRIGLLTGGGDCPGLNAVIRAVVRKGIWIYGDEFVGFKDGWRGVLEDTGDPLTIESTAGTLARPYAAELLAKSLARGAATTGDFAFVDHFALAPLPLADVRARFGVRPPDNPADGHHLFW